MEESVINPQRAHISLSDHLALEQIKEKKALMALGG